MDLYAIGDPHRKFEFLGEVHPFASISPIPVENLTFESRKISTDFAGLGTNVIGLKRKTDFMSSAERYWTPRDIEFSAPLPNKGKHHKCH